MGDLALTSRIWLAREPDLANMTLRQLALLSLLCDEEGPHRVRTMATGIGVTKPVVTRAMAALNALHMVTRHRDPDDGRDCFYRPTPLGEVVRERMKECV